MRSLNAKRIAAVAAGAAMLGLALGTAFGACPDISKDWVYDTSGNPIVQIVVGSDAGISDGIAAANLAAVIGSKAYVSGGQKTLTPTAHGSVKIKAQGAVSTPTEGVWADQTMTGQDAESGEFSLTLGEAQGMYSGKASYNGEDYDYKEKVEVNGVKVKYGEDKDYHGIYFENTRNKIGYTLDFIKPFPDPDGKLNQTVEIKFLGKDYVLNEVHPNKIVLMSGQKVSMGIGQSTTITMGGTTYTVTLKDASYNEGDETGYAVVEVSDGTNTYTLDLDTASNEDGNAGDLYVYLQGVAKSYTPGVGGTAILRLGGEKLELKDGLTFPGDDKWKVKIITTGTNHDIDAIQLNFNKNYTPDDEVSEIVGPEGYFTLKYDGTNLDLGTIQKGTVKFVGDSDKESGTEYTFIKSVTYTDKNSKSYTFDPYNVDDHHAAIFHAETGGAIENDASAGTSSDPYTLLPLRESDYIAVGGVPVKIDSIYYDPSDPSKSYVSLEIPGESSVKYYLSNEGSPTYNADGNYTLTDGTHYADFLALKSGNQATHIYCGDIDVSTNVGSKEIGVCITGDDYVDYSSTEDSRGAEPTMWVYKGASTNLESKYYTLEWDNPTWNTDHFNAGNLTMEIKEKTPLTGDYDVGYAITGTSDEYKGIQVKVHGGTTLADQALQDTDYEDNKYHVTQDAVISADGDEATIIVPEKQLEARVELIPGAASGSETAAANEAVVTTDMDLPYEVASGVTVEDLTCTADPITVDTGYTFGTVPDNLVISDATTPTAQHVIVIGGYSVNKLAVGHTESLQASGDSVCEFSDDGNTLYVAGYSAQDTMNVIDELISKIKAL